MMAAYSVVSGIATFIAVVVLGVFHWDEMYGEVLVWPVMIALTAFFVGLAIVAFTEKKSGD